MPHLPIAYETAKKVVKANLIKPASQASRFKPNFAGSRHLSKPAEEGPHNSAWDLANGKEIAAVHVTSAAECFYIDVVNNNFLRHCLAPITLHSFSC